MLESLRQCEPGTIGVDISAAAWTRSIAGNVAITALSVALFYGGYQHFAVRLGYGLTAVLLTTAGVVCAITAALYIYYVYIVGSTSSGEVRKDSAKAK
jgi:hypothetical protein